MAKSNTYIKYALPRRLLAPANFALSMKDICFLSGPVPASPPACEDRTRQMASDATATRGTSRRYAMGNKRAMRAPLLAMASWIVRDQAAAMAKSALILKSSCSGGGSGMVDVRQTKTLQLGKKSVAPPGLQ